MKRLGLLVIGYGIFLAACGLAGYALASESSSSAIVNGVVFGSLMIIMGILLRQGRPWTLPASLSATAIFALTFVWRGSLQWFEVWQGADQLSPIAALHTVMMIVSVGVGLQLLKRVRA